MAAAVRLGELGFRMAFLPIRSEPRDHPVKNLQAVKTSQAGEDLTADVVDERVARLAAAVERARERELAVIAATVSERIVSARRWIRLADLPQGGVMDDRVEKVLVESGEQLLRFFMSGHLPPKLQAISQQYAAVAVWTVENVAKSAERTVALRKVLEGKDAAVRAAL